MSFRSWVKRRDHPLANLIWRAAKAARRVQVPCVGPIHRPLYQIRLLTLHLWNEAWRVLWWTPLFQSRLVRPAPGLYLYSGVPQVLGSLDIEFGSGCTISGKTSLIGRTASTPTPRLVLGDGAEIGWQTTIAVGRRVEIGRNVKIAAQCFLAGFPGHPQDPTRRAAQLPDDDDQSGDIILEDDVWLATGVTVVAGVRIGKGSIVTPGSVVFRDIPPGVIATGNPAKISGLVKVDQPAEVDGDMPEAAIPAPSVKQGN